MQRAVGRSEGVVIGGGAIEGRVQVVAVCVAVVYGGLGVLVIRSVDDGAVWGELSDPLAMFNGWPFGVEADMEEGDGGGTLTGRVASIR